MSAYAEPRACGKCGSVQFQSLLEITASPDAFPSYKRGRWEACQYCGSTAEPVDPPKDPFLPET